MNELKIKPRTILIIVVNLLRNPKGGVYQNITLVLQITGGGGGGGPRWFKKCLLKPEIWNILAKIQVGSKFNMCDSNFISKIISIKRYKSGLL